MVLQQQDVCYYRNLKITSALDEIYGGICKKAHAATELAEGLRLNLFMKSPFDPVEDYQFMK